MWTQETCVGQVTELRRYPVKSMGGELLDAIELDRRGVALDRLWATRGDRGKLGSGKNSRRFQRVTALARLRARYDEGVPVITLPDGGECRADDPLVDKLLSEACGQPVTLHRETDETHFDTGPVHVATTEAIERVAAGAGVPVDHRRLRANILIETTPGLDERLREEHWLGHCLAGVGGAVLEIIGRMDRCMMVNQGNGDLPPDNRVLKAINGVNQMMLGVFGRVIRTGKIRVGDDVRLIGTRSVGGAGS